MANAKLNILLGKNIRHFRDAIGLTQLELANQVGVEGGGYISNVENGKIWPRPEVLEKITKALGVKTIDLFNEETGGLDKSMNRWVAKFHSLFKKMDEHEVEDLYDYVKKLSRKKRSGRK